MDDGNKSADLSTTIREIESHSPQSASKLVRALAALDRESEEHKQIYEDLKDE